MEVTQGNFRETLPLVKEALDRCVFAAVETELTGKKTFPSKTVDAVLPHERKLQA